MGSSSPLGIVDSGLMLLRLLPFTSPQVQHPPEDRLVKFGVIRKWVSSNWLFNGWLNACHFR